MISKPLNRDNDLTVTSCVSNHRQFYGLFNSLFRQTHRKYHSTVLLTLCMGNPSVIGGLQTQWASNAERISMSWCHHWYTVSALAVTFVNITHKKLPQISRVMVRYMCCSCGLTKVLHRSLLCSAQYRFILVSDISRLNIKDPKLFSPLMAVNGGQTKTYRLNIIEYQYVFTWLQYIFTFYVMTPHWYDTGT